MDLPLHFKQLLQKSRHSVTCNCNINLVFSLVYSSTNKGTTGKSYTSAAHSLHTSQLFLCPTETCDVPDTFLTPCFLLVVSSFFHSFPVFLNFFFCHANIRESRRLFYVCVGLIFFESQNKQHAYLLHVQKMQNVCFN